jgi:hypothetical protein
MINLPVEEMEGLWRESIPSLMNPDRVLEV